VTAFSWLVVAAGAAAGVGCLVGEQAFLRAAVVPGALTYVSGFTIISAMGIALEAMALFIVVGSVVRLPFVPDWEYRQLRGYRRSLVAPALFMALVSVPLTASALQAVSLDGDELHVWAIDLEHGFVPSQESCALSDLRIGDRRYHSGNVKRFYVTPGGFELKEFLAQGELNQQIAAASGLPLPQTTRR